MESPQPAAAALPSLTELGLLVQHQQSLKSWWTPSLPDFSHRSSTGDRSRSASRTSSPVRKRLARSRDREKGDLSFASGPLPFPMLIRSSKHAPPARGADASLPPKESREKRRGRRSISMIVNGRRHDIDNNTDESDAAGRCSKHGLDSRQGSDSRDEESTDSNTDSNTSSDSDSDSDDDDVSCSLQRPLAPMRWPLSASDAKTAAPPPGSSHGGDLMQLRQDRRQVSRGREDGDSPSRPRLFPLRWPLKRQRVKRKREASPSRAPPPPPPPSSRPGSGWSSEQEAREAPGGASSSSSSSSSRNGINDNDKMPVRLTLRRRVPRSYGSGGGGSVGVGRFTGLGMMRAGDMIRSLVSEARRNGELNVLYKFDRVDELGGRRRGERW